jgi:uncharacterized protein YndB with AHSA1/START domain
MKMDAISRRDIAIAVGALVAAAGAGQSVLADDRMSASRPGDGVSRNHPAIHQEIDFAAEPMRVYQTLTQVDLFDRVEQLTAAEWHTPTSRTEPARIDARPGGTFALFGGYISGFNLELVPAVRVVQAWRVGNWPAGKFSIASFALSGSGGKTHLVFDHTGFPDEAADHLAGGWHGHYWEPLAKILRS